MPRIWLDAGAVMIIAGYRRYLSPHKGYRCAYHAATGRGSCSHYAQQAIARAGLWRGLRLLRRRFARCALAATVWAQAQAQAQTPEAPPSEQKFFGRCDPAVREIRKLCCTDMIAGLGEWDGN